MPAQPEPAMFRDRPVEVSGTAKPIAAKPMLSSTYPLIHRKNEKGAR